MMRGKRQEADGKMWDIIHAIQEQLSRVEDKLDKIHDKLDQVRVIETKDVVVDAFQSSTTISTASPLPGKLSITSLSADRIQSIGSEFGKKIPFFALNIWLSFCCCLLSFLFVRTIAQTLSSPVATGHI
jgi:hypothetical protein